MSGMIAEAATRTYRPDTRQTHVVDQLRIWAIEGKFDPEEKLTEAGLAEALNVSRTPIRHALAVLVEEGVLHRAGPRGYKVRSYTVSDVIEAVEFRAVVEGYAASKLARKGVSTAAQSAIEACLADGDEIFRDAGDDGVDERRYAAMNARFHTLIAEAAGVDLVYQTRNLIDRIPFGTPDAIRFETRDRRARAEHLQLAHWQHHYILAAVTAGDGARAEALFREHGELIKVSLGLAKGILATTGKRVQPIIDPGSPVQTLRG